MRSAYLRRNTRRLRPGVLASAASAAAFAVIRPRARDKRRSEASVGERAWDVVVVGAGNAAFCAALAAREAGASVVMLERAPREENGGNSRFT
ncbi:MAG: FAD-dependent oxidoreductase, partial [Microvirga sp.]